MAVRLRTRGRAASCSVPTTSARRRRQRRTGPAGMRNKNRHSKHVGFMVAWRLDDAKGPLVPRELSKSIWRRMELALGLLGHGRSGMRLVRRSVATLARKRLGEENRSQGRIMLGHVQPITGDIHAVSVRPISAVLWQLSGSPTGSSATSVRPASALQSTLAV